jgi:hypothetical protein
MRGKLKMLAVTEERARLGLVAAKPPPIAQAPEISEEQIKAACEDLVAREPPDPRISVVGRSERRGPLRRRFVI